MRVVLLAPVSSRPAGEVVTLPAREAVDLIAQRLAYPAPASVERAVPPTPERRTRRRSTTDG